ncbi:MAG: hypothetical protein WCI73_05615 [Phycisphaerae bacterium]
MNLPRRIDLIYLNTLGSLNEEQKYINMLAYEAGFVGPLDDRFGIFFDNPYKTLTLSDLYTDKSFAEITDLTAQTYIDKNVAVCWSGGIDSSLIVAALYKHNIDFQVTVTHDRCKAENPDMYEWVLKNCKVIDLDEATYFNNLYDHVKSGGSIVSGDPADQLFPSIRYNLLPGVEPQKGLYKKNMGYGDNLKLFTQTYSDEYFYNNIIERIKINCDLVSEKFTLPDSFSEEVTRFVIRRLLLSNIHLKHYYQLKWLIKFTFKYKQNLQRVSKMVEKYFTNNDRDPVDFVQYDVFDTLEYQSWAWTNLDKNFETQSLTALTYKMDAKQYIADVTGLSSQLNLIKIPSL